MSQLAAEQPSRRGAIWGTIIGGVVMTLVAGLIVAIKRAPLQPAHPTEVRIMRFYYWSTRFRGGRFTVVVEDPQGLYGQATTTGADFSCVVGDTVRATREGVALYPDLSTCMGGGHGIARP